MPTSQARIEANRRNSLLSTGPVTTIGKEASRRNSYKHGMSGAGIVLADDDAAEVERRNDALLREMVPKSEMGQILVREMATMSVRMEVSARHEFAATAERVRNAADAFDEQRVTRAEALMATLGEDPRGNLRRLKKSPEGLELLIDAWRELRSDLTRPVKPLWTAAHLVKAANMLGIREEDARGSRIGVLSDAIWGDFSGLGNHEGGDLDEDARKAWARAEVVKLIGRAFDELATLGEAIDFEMIDLDRAEAGSRALFDASKPAILARRYESEASRRFFKAFKDFRKVEAEAAERPIPPPAPPKPPINQNRSPLASFRDGDLNLDPAPLEMAPEHLWPVSREVLAQGEVVRGADGRPLTIGMAANLTT